MKKLDLIKHRKHMEIMMKHQDRMHRELGEFYGYPKCCVEQFVEENNKGILSAMYRSASFRFSLEWLQLNYVPCDKCMAQIISKIK